MNVTSGSCFHDHFKYFCKPGLCFYRSLLGCLYFIQDYCTPIHPSVSNIPSHSFPPRKLNPALDRVLNLPEMWSQLAFQGSPRGCVYDWGWERNK